MKILLRIAFIGSGYCGYQVQPNGVTVQQRLNEAAEALFGYECDIVGCSRTDSGVHANEFCVAVSKKRENRLETNIPIERIPMAMSVHLPVDISVMSAEWVDDDFHPRYDVKYKEYVYRIYNSPVRSPFEEGRAWHIPYTFDDDALTQMNAAAQAFVGKHDFASFMASGSKVESTVRTVMYADVVKEGDVITFRVAADGFLYNMVRIMTGTLVAVAQKKIAAFNIPAVIEAKDRQRAGMTAPAHGLYLNRVVY